MSTKKQLLDEIEDLRQQLYQEREDHKHYIQDLRNTAFNLAKERTRVKSILIPHKGVLVQLPIVNIEQEWDGINIIVDEGFRNCEVIRR